MDGEYCKGYGMPLDELAAADFADCVYHCEFDTCDGCHSYIVREEHLDG